MELTFDVPDRLVGRFYIAVGSVLRGAQEQDTTAETETEPELHEWAAETFDSERAGQAWRKFSPRAQAVFSLLMENPGVSLTADEIAAKVGLANGRHSLAGLVAWPSRACADMGLMPPFRVEAPGAPGEVASYWMDPETARLFLDARERAQAKRTGLGPEN